jgi:NTP pyrophosphatase (non-canonical NTP hydrolase)
MSDIKILEQRALEIRRRYDEFNKSQSGQPWDGKKLAHGFKKDVEDLIDILEAKTVDQKKLNHELGDCLWSVLVIAHKLGVDIEREFWTTMGELDNRLDKATK